MQARPKKQMWSHMLRTALKTGLIMLLQVCSYHANTEVNLHPRLRPFFWDVVTSL